MLLMWKLLATTLLLSSLVHASVSGKDVEKFIKNSFKNNPNILSIELTTEHSMKLKKPKGWSAFIVKADAVLKKDKRKVNQKMIWFSNGEVITQDLLDMDTGKSLKDLVSPEFKSEYYKDSNLIYGDKNAKHKVVIFSDPLCPFCRNFVPKAINEMKEKPETFAVYYFHFPLPSLHPAAVELVKAAKALELRGTHKDVVLKLYQVKIDAKERNVEKILKAFNSTMKSNIKPADLNSVAVQKHLKDDLDRASSMMVQGTPTMFFDGKIDKQKNKYKTAK